MKLQDLDPRVFEIDLERKQAKCRVCVQTRNQDEYHSTRHSVSKAHINAARAFLEDITTEKKAFSVVQQPHPYQHFPSRSVCPQTSSPLARYLDETPDPPNQPVEPPPLLGDTRSDSEVRRERTSELFKEILSDLARGDGFDVDLGGLWDAEEKPAVDYYEEILGSIGRRAFRTVVAQEEDEVGLGDDESSSGDGFEAGLPGTATIKAASGTGSNDSEATAPWSTLELYLTHLLFSSPRLRFSDAQKEAILSWGREMGAKNVPSISAYERARDQLHTTLGGITEKMTAPSGRVFYMNDIGAAIARDMSNPYIRQGMQFYPEFAHGRASEVWHGTKWLLDAPDDILTPTARVNGEIYWVDELSQLSDGGYFIPTRFFIVAPKDGKSNDPKALWARGHNVYLHEDGLHVQPQAAVIPTARFSKPYTSLMASRLLVRFAEGSLSFASKMPHPFREKARGRMVYGIPLILFMDDASGNVTKQWNKHYNIYLSNAALTRQILDQEYCTHFITTSPHARPMELMQGARGSIDTAFCEGVVAWDCKEKEEVVLRPWGLFWPGDGPMQAEECSQAGLCCNYWCRTCDAGGSQEYKRSDEGYLSLFKPGNYRSPAQTIELCQEQIRIAVQSGAASKLEAHMREHGTKDWTVFPILEDVAEIGKVLRKREEGKVALPNDEAEAALQLELDRTLKDYIGNPLLDMKGVDIHRDTPTEILHTVLLGVVKYFWGQSVFVINQKKKFDEFKIRFQSLSLEGLNIPSPALNYICTYPSSLVGKHLKTLVQVMVLLVDGLVEGDLLDAWGVLGDLVVLLWHTEIEDMEPYLSRLSESIEKLFDLTAKCSPSIIISKPKFHFLVHLPEFIRRFGPAIIFSTERYESFNGVFRRASTLSNRQAPSRDICKAFAEQEMVKHIVSGGYWLDPNLKKWVQAGLGVLEHFRDHPEHQRLLGVPRSEEKSCGTVTLRPKEEIHQPNGGNPVRQRPPMVSWASTQAYKFPSTQGIALPTTLMHLCHSVVTVNGDIAKVGSKVIFRLPPPANEQSSSSNTEASERTLGIGEVEEILAQADWGTAGVLRVCVRIFEFEDVRHPSMDLPLIKRSEKQILLARQDVLCVANVAHNCSATNCTERRVEFVYQERVKTAITKSFVKHNDSARFILNTHALHNHVLIRELVPVALFGSSYASPSSKTLRLQAAKSMRTKKQQQTIEGKLKLAIKKGESVEVLSRIAQGQSMPSRGATPAPAVVPPSPSLISSNLRSTPRLAATPTPVIASASQPRPPPPLPPAFFSHAHTPNMDSRLSVVPGFAPIPAMHSSQPPKFPSPALWTAAPGPNPTPSLIHTEAQSAYSTHRTSLWYPQGNLPLQNPQPFHSDRRNPYLPAGDPLRQESCPPPHSSSAQPPQGRPHQLAQGWPAAERNPSPSNSTLLGTAKRLRTEYVTPRFYLHSLSTQTIRIIMESAVGRYMLGARTNQGENGPPPPASGGLSSSASRLPHTEAPNRHAPNPSNRLFLSPSPPQDPLSFAHSQIETGTPVPTSRGRARSNLQEQAVNSPSQPHRFNQLSFSSAPFSTSSPLQTSVASTTPDYSVSTTHLSATVLPQTTGSPVDETSRRRRRDESSSPQKQQRKRLHLLASETALDLGLQNVKALQDYSQLDLPAMLVIQHAHTLKSHEQEKIRELKEKIHSRTWQSSLDLKLTIALASDQAASYIVGTTERLLHRIPQNPQLWDLPEEIRNDATEWSYFASTLKELLTSVRGAMKQKIKKSHDQQEDIASLANGIGSRKGANMIIKRSHWARYAFLRQCYREFHVAPTYPSPPLSPLSGKVAYAKDNYWEYVDDKLDEIRQEAQLEQDPKAHEASAFTLILTNDMTMYQGISGQAASQAAGSLLPFQTALSGALESS